MKSLDLEIIVMHLSTSDNGNSQHLWSDYRVPDVVPSTSRIRAHLNLTIPQAEDGEAQMGPVTPKRWNQDLTLAVGFQCLFS